MADRSHLSIGEVLSLLREEFPDVTISKIRFLESQGLVDPERTPSGYRKFYEHDVERLRWILRQQRENFLPLKVIRGRLNEQEADEEVEDATPGSAPAAPSAASGASAMPAARGGSASPADSGPEPTASAVSSSAPTSAAAAGLGPTSAAATGEGRAGGRAEPAPAPERPASPGFPQAAAVRKVGPDRAVASMQSPGGGQPEEPEPETYTAEELAAASGADRALVADLQEYGILTPQGNVGGTIYFDAVALEVARAAAGFARHGIEPRHLRPWRNHAEREAVLFEQVVLPLLRQRNPNSRRLASETLEELASLGADLRAALVRQSLGAVR